MDYAQAPCTPGLIEEPNLSNVQETSACDEHVESEDNHLLEAAAKENLENTSSRLNLHQGNEHMADWSMPNENGYHSSDMGIKKGMSPSTKVNIEHISSNDHDAVSGLLADKIVTASGNLDRDEELQDEIVKTDGTDVPSVDMSHENREEIIGFFSEGLKDASGLVSLCLQGTEGDGENSNNLGNAERPSSPRDASQFGADFQDTSGLREPETRASEEPKDSQTSNLDNEIPSGHDNILRPCNAGLGEPDSSHTGAEHPNDLEPSDIAAVQMETSKRVGILQASGASTLEQGLSYYMITIL